MAATNSSAAALVSDAMMSPGSGWPSGNAASMPQARSSCVAGAQRENRLAVAILVLDEFERPAVGAKRADGFVAVGKHQCVVEHGRRRFQADVHLDGIARRPVAPSPASSTRSAEPHLRWSADRRGPRAPHRHTRPPRGSRLVESGCCRHRVAQTTTAPARPDTSGVTSRVMTFGIGAGISRMPSPAATLFGKFRRDIHQARHHPLAESPASARATARSGRR